MRGIKNFTKYLMIGLTLILSLQVLAAEQTPTATSTTIPAATSAPTKNAVDKAATSPAQNSEAGKVVITFGKEVKAVDANKKERALTRQSAVFQGDTLKTGNESRMQIRLTDDTALVMRPDSEFRIDAYKFDPKDTSQNKNFESLTKGGLRMITGAIAKADNAKFSLTTPVAVIGVRGTEFIAVFKNGVLYVTVISGKIVITNKTGTITIGIGERFQSAMVSSADAKPEGLVEPNETISACKAS